MAKATKQTKKFVSSGKLKQEITKRRKYQAIKQKTAGREATKLRKERKGKGKHADDDSELEGSDDEDEDVTLPADEDDEEGGKKGKAVEGLKALAGVSASPLEDTSARS
jgi:nucleolar complex protein 2